MSVSIEMETDFTMLMDKRKVTLLSISNDLFACCAVHNKALLFYSLSIYFSISESISPNGSVKSSKQSSELSKSKSGSSNASDSGSDSAHFIVSSD